MQATTTHAMTALPASARHDHWTSSDPRNPDASSLPHIGPLPDEIAEMLASFEFCRGALQTADWSNLESLTLSARTWPRRVPEMQAGHRYHVAYWHGEEAYQVRMAIFRSGKRDRITLDSARRAVEWRYEYLRRQLLKMLGDTAQGALARGMLDGLRLTYGRTRLGEVRWYGFDSLA